MEDCYECGGQCGCPGSDFGDYGFHPCFKCGATGLLPEGTQEREQQLATELAQYDRRPYSYGGFDCGEGD